MNDSTLLNWINHWNSCYTLNSAGSFSDCAYKAGAEMLMTDNAVQLDPAVLITNGGARLKVQNFLRQKEGKSIS